MKKTPLNISKLFYLVPIATLFFFTGCAEEETPPTEVSLQSAAENPGTWTWIGKEEMLARDGSTTGYLANLESNSRKLVIYLQGGGACFNALTCDQNPSRFNTADANSFIQNNPNPLFFKRSTGENPFSDWNFIFVPYSTGDVHAGINMEANVPNSGPANQKMVGYNNFTVILEDLLEYFNGDLSPTDIIVTGSSAGSFGAYLNFYQTAETFGNNVQLTGLFDAGILLSGTSIFEACLNDTWQNLWNIATPADLNTVVPEDFPYEVQKVYTYSARKYPNANFGLISSYGDDTMRFFWGFGANGCIGVPGNVTAQAYKENLLDLQTSLSAFDNWKVFYTEGGDHTFLLTPRVTYTVNGTSIINWVEQLHAGTASDVLE